MDDEFNDRKYECKVDSIREKEAMANLSDNCYEHGIKLGAIIQSTLAQVESTFGKLKPIDYLAIAESITESVWDALDEEIGQLYPDYDEVENGICDSSELYLHAKRAYEITKQNSKLNTTLADKE
jgi:hypothetical protein